MAESDSILPSISAASRRVVGCASEPEREGEVDITVERIEDGEVSTYLHNVLVPGDRIEVRGPIGGYFVWEATMDEPLLLIAGGSGVVPLMSMIRHRAAARGKNPTGLLYSSRNFEDVIYYNELGRLSSSNHGVQVIHALTRHAQ